MLNIPGSHWFAVGTLLCHPYICPGSQVDQLGTHGFSCSKSQGRQSRHAAIIGIVRHLLAPIKVLLHLEPSGICHSDGKHPDGASIVPWKNGRVLVWDVTCVDTFGTFMPLWYLIVQVALLTGQNI